MKALIYHIIMNTILILMSASVCNAQVVDLHLDKALSIKDKSSVGKVWSYAKPLIIPSALMYTSGAFNGLMDLNRNHYSQYAERFSITNHQWHDPNISWTNKYKKDSDGQLVRPLQPKFFMSNTLFVGTTDAWHAYQSGMLTFWSAGMYSYSFNITKSSRDRRKWYWILIDVIWQRLAWSAGFHTTYTGVRRGWW